MASKPIDRTVAAQQKLKRLMKTHSLKSHEVAAMTAYRPQTVRQWMCGRRPVPERAFKLLALQLPK